MLQMKKKEFFFFYALWIEDTAAAKEIFHATVVQRTIVYIFWCYLPKHFSASKIILHDMETTTYHLGKREKP